MKALGDQCWVNTSNNFGTCYKWRLNDVDDDIVCSTWQEYKRDYAYIHNNICSTLLKDVYYYMYINYLKLFPLHNQLHLLDLLDASNGRFKVQVQLYLFSYYDIHNTSVFYEHIV